MPFFKILKNRWKFKNYRRKLSIAPFFPEFDIEENSCRISCKRRKKLLYNCDLTVFIRKKMEKTSKKVICFFATNKKKSSISSEILKTPSKYKIVYHQFSSTKLPSDFQISQYIKHKNNFLVYFAKTVLQAKNASRMLRGFDNSQFRIGTIWG